MTAVIDLTADPRFAMARPRATHTALFPMAPAPSTTRPLTDTRPVAAPDTPVIWFQERGTVRNCHSDRPFTQAGLIDRMTYYCDHLDAAFAAGRMLDAAQFHTLINQLLMACVEAHAWRRRNGDPS